MAHQQTHKFLKLLLAGECLIICHFSPDFRQIIVRLSDLGATDQSGKEPIDFLRIIHRILAVKAGKDRVQAVTFDIIERPIWRRCHIQMLHPLAQFDEGSGISSVMLASDDMFDVIREEWLTERKLRMVALGMARLMVHCSRQTGDPVPAKGYWTSIVVRDGDA